MKRFFKVFVVSFTLLLLITGGLAFWLTQDVLKNPQGTLAKVVEDVKDEVIGPDKPDESERPSVVWAFAKLLLALLLSVVFIYQCRYMLNSYREQSK